ncbi:RNA polymerase II mediator complex subunit [Dissophora globulifera]|uniref:Mediator of RNA polymerase II transcription subunit 21 n=1 Tax=Dissophora globulifera TaxID=979702 RepID=A0A9P6RLB1_9FUNG|nr:RNA polymerase II mediator complex subunit [Dissophora globulifera]
MSDTDDSAPKPRKPQPKPRSRRMVKAATERGSSPSGTASNSTSSPPHARRRIEDDFFSKAKNYREVSKVQETIVDDLSSENFEAPELEPILISDDMPILDFEVEARSKNPVEDRKKAGAEESGSKRKREISLTPPPEPPTRQYAINPLIPLRTIPTASVINLDDDFLREEPEPELDPELQSIAAKVISTPLSPSSKYSQSQLLSQSPSSSQLSSSQGTSSVPGSTSANSANIYNTPSSQPSLPDHNVLGAAGMLSPSTSASSPLSAAESTPPETVDILLRMIKDPNLVVTPELEARVKELETHIKVTVKADDNFRKTMEWYCQLKRIPFANMIFTYRQTRLIPSSTPRSLGFPSRTVVDVYDSVAYHHMKEQEGGRLRELERQADEAAALEATIKRQHQLIQQRKVQQEQQEQQRQSGADGREQDREDSEQIEAAGEEEEEVEYLYIKLRGKDTTDEKIRVKKTTTVQTIITHYKSIKKIAAETPVKLEFDDETIDPTTSIGETDVEDDDMLISFYAPPMDRLTQLQDAIDKLALLFVSSLDHLTKNAPLVPLNPNVPVVNTVHGIPHEQLLNSAQELALDISRQAKELETLIDNLPGISQTPEDQTRDLEILAQQNAEATEEYEAVVAEARELLQEITLALRDIAEDQSRS